MREELALAISNLQQEHKLRYDNRTAVLLLCVYEPMVTIIISTLHEDVPQTLLLAHVITFSDLFKS